MILAIPAWSITSSSTSLRLQSTSYLMYEDNSRPYLAKILLVYIQEQTDTQGVHPVRWERLSKSFGRLLIILSKRIYWVSSKSRSHSKDIVNESNYFTISSDKLTSWLGLIGSYLVICKFLDNRHLLTVLVMSGQLHPVQDGLLPASIGQLNLGSGR